MKKKLDNKIDCLNCQSNIDVYKIWGFPIIFAVLFFVTSLFLFFNNPGGEYLGVSFSGPISFLLLILGIYLRRKENTLLKFTCQSCGAIIQLQLKKEPDGDYKWFPSLADPPDAKRINRNVYLNGQSGDYVEGKGLVYDLSDDSGGIAWIRRAPLTDIDSVEIDNNTVRLVGSRVIGGKWIKRLILLLIFAVAFFFFLYLANKTGLLNSEMLAPGKSPIWVLPAALVLAFSFFFTLGIKRIVPRRYKVITLKGDDIVDVSTEKVGDNYYGSIDFSIKEAPKGQVKLLFAGSFSSNHFKNIVLDTKKKEPPLD